MKIVNSIARWFGRTAKSITLFFGGGGASRLFARSPSEDELRSVFSIIFKCVDKRATEIAAAKLQIKTPDDKVIERHKVLEFLAQPNPLQSGNEFFYFAQAYIDTLGECFVYLERLSPGRRPSAMYHLRPDRVQIEFDNDGNIGAYVYQAGGETTTFDPQDIIHVKRPNLSNPARGTSIIRAAAFEVDEHKLMHESRIGLLQNDSTPPYVIAPRDGTNMTESQIEKIENSIRAKHQGPHKRGNVLILPGSFEAKPLNVSHAELYYLAEIGASTKSIALMFGTPLAVMGDVTDFNRANAEAARLIFLSETCEPEAARLYSGFSEPIMNAFGLSGYEIVYDLMIPEDRIIKRDEAVALVASGIISINEARENLGYQPVALPAASLLMGSALRVPIGTDILQRQTPMLAGTSGVQKGLYANPEVQEIKIKSITRKQLAFERVMQRAMDDFFDEQSKKVRAELRKSYRKEIVPSVEVYLPDAATEGIRLAAHLSPQVQEILRSFAEDEADSIGQRFVYDPELPAIQTWLGENLTNRMTRINETTIEGLKQVLQDGVNLGESIDKISQRVADFFGQEKGYRSERIARTEVIGASNRGNYAAIEATGTPYKQWLTAEDDRVRDTHVIANQSVVSWNEYFEVGGSLLLHPGDMTSGSPEEIINCRCVLVPAFEPEG